jgi:hypothetical protein
MKWNECRYSWHDGPNVRRSEHQNKASHHPCKDHGQAICTTEAKSKCLYLRPCTSLAWIGRRVAETCIGVRASGRTVCSAGRSGSGFRGCHATYCGGIDPDWVLGATRMV